MDDHGEVLLVCTVGGSPEPIVTAIKRWRPVRVAFVHSPGTRGEIDKVLTRASDEGVKIDAGGWDPLEVPDEQNLAGCIDRLRQLADRVQEWVGRGSRHHVIVDFTGGTKCMSSALTLVARRWPCRFSYVGGIKRTKEGVGIVVSGTEQVFTQSNPWEADAHRTVDEYSVLFDQGAFVPAAHLVEEARSRVERAQIKQELTALHHLAKSCDAWDRFDHEGALRHMKQVVRHGNDLRAVLSQHTGDRVLVGIDRTSRHLNVLVAESPPGRTYVVDLVANAARRRDEGRFDDAVARLYRAIEALAQIALRSRGFAYTESVPVEQLPEPLQRRWSSQAEDGHLRIGLQGSYALLAELGDDLGARFRELKLDDLQHSPLGARNRSILAHGFEPISRDTFGSIYTAVLELGAIRDADLPCFPKIAAKCPKS